MNDLSQYLVETLLLTEAVKNKVVVYSGRFQPFHAGHYKTYKHLCSVFGAKNVYIASSNIQDSNKSPLSFNEKRDIAVRVFGIPPSKFIQVRSPYQPVEILRDFNDVDTALIVAVGEKDETRLGGKYFQPYKGDKDLQGYATAGYVYSKNPSNSFGATDVRNMFRSNLSHDEKEKQFKKFFGKYDDNIFQMLDKELNESKDYVPGGLAQGLSLAQIAQKHKVDFDEFKKEFKKGVNVEKEHTDDIRVAAEIAKDHLYEDPKYYDKLMQIESDINYEPDEVDFDNILDSYISDPATGKKYKIKDALKLDRKEFAYQEAMRVLGYHAMMHKRQVPGNFLDGEQSPEGETAHQVNLGLYNSYGEGIVKEASVKGSGYDAKMLNQLVDNPQTGQKIKVSSALNYPQSHPAYKSAMELIARQHGKLKLHKIKQKQKAGYETKPEPKQQEPSVSKVAKKVVENPKVVMRAIAQNIKQWSKKEKEFFRGAHKPESNERRSFSQFMVDKTQGIIKGVKREMKHLGHEIGEATGGIKALFSGQKPNDHQKKAMIAMAKTVGLTLGSIALSGGAGELLHHGLGSILSHVGTHLAEHMVGEVALFGIGKAALHAGVEDENDDKYIEWFILQLADNIRSGNIPNEVWLKAVEDYNKDKEAGKVSEKDWGGPNELKEDGFPGGAGVGLSLPGGYINGAPDEDDVEKTRKKLDKSDEEMFEAFTKGQLYKGTLKLGGNKVEVEVELVGADNKSNQFITKVIHIDKEYQHKLPIGSTLPIPARIFRFAGDWRKIKTPSAFGEMAKADLDKVEKYADNQLSPEDIVLGKETDHFFQRLNDPRNGKEISPAELTGFFKRLAKNKKKFLEFIKKYNEFVVKDKRTGINIPFMVKANKLIAKTIMRKDDFKSSTPIYTTENINESLLMEGGAYGHMHHPFDTDINLTFGDLKNIVNKALDGELGVVREKTDGQALAISWKNGRLIAARNKGHLANAGENALDAAGMAQKFNGRGALSDAYNYAMKDLESAIRGLSEKQKEKIFMNGKAFMNLEVIWPTSVNVIPYGQALLVFHNAVEYNEAGNAVGQIKGAETILAGMIKQINAHVQSKYTIQGPPLTKLPKNMDLGKLKPKFMGMVTKLQSEFGLGDKDGIADYHQAWWKNFIQKSGKKLESLEVEGLVKRWAFDDKSFGIKQIGDTNAKDWAEKIEKQDKAKIAKENTIKFEEIFLGVGAAVLEFMESVLTVKPDEASQAIRRRIESTIDKVKAEGTPAQIQKLELELRRLDSLGGFEKIVPNEGIIFNYKGNVFKLTGKFAAINQLLGIFY